MRLEEIAHLPRVVDTVAEKFADLGALPTMEQVRSLARWDASLVEKFDRKVDDLPGDRSSAMTELAYLFAEHSWTDEQMYVGLIDVDDRWGKFVQRPQRHRLITDLVNRARQKVGYGFGEVDAAAIVARIEGVRPVADDGRRKRLSIIDFNAQSFPVAWQLEGLLTSTGFGLLVAPPGTGKSQMLLDLAFALATGRERYLHWRNVAGPQRVLWLSLEMEEVGLQLFTSQIAAAYDSPEDVAKLRENFIIEPIGEQLPLDQEAGQKWLEGLLTEVEPDIVMIDSLQMVTSKEMTDELSVKTMMGYLAKVRKDHRTSMLVVHHHRKKSTEAAKKHVLELDDVYGSRYITASVDVVLGLTKETEDVLELKTMKNRYAKMDHPFPVIRTGRLTFELEGAGANHMRELMQ